MPTANLGDIAFGVVADTTRLTAALAQIRAFGNAVDAIATAQANAGKTMDAAWQRQEAAIVRATIAQEKFNAELTKAGAPQAMLNANMTSFNRLINDLTGSAAPLTKLDFSRSMNEFNASIARGKADFVEWGNNAKNAGGIADKFSETMEKIARAAQLITGPLSGTAFRITLLSEMMREGTLASTALISGFAGAAYAFTKLGESATAAATQMIPIQNQIKAVSGSMMQTQLDMQMVMDVANKFGLQFQDLAKQFAGLAAAARGTRLEGEGIRDMFVQLAAVSGNLTLSQEKMAGMFQEVERLLSMGVVQWRNLRELSRDIPNIYELISKTIGTDTVAALEKFLKLGTEASDVLLPKLISQIVKAYGIDVTKQVDNLTAAHERFNNALFRFMTALDSAVGFSDRAMRSYDALRNILDYLSANMDKVAKIALVAAAAVAGLVASYIITGFGRLAAAIIEVGKAIATMNLLAAGSPITILIRLAAAIAGAYVGYQALDKIIGQVNTSLLTSTTDIEKYIEAWNKNKEGFSSNTTVMIDNVKKLQTAASAELAGTVTKLRALEDQYKSLNEQLDKPTAPGWFQTAAGKSAEVEANIKAIREQMDALTDQQTKQVADVNKYNALAAQLLIIKQQQLAVEKAMPGIKPGDNDAVIRQKEALEKLQTALKGVDDEWHAIGLGPDVLAKAFEKAKVATQIESMQNALEKAGYSMNTLRTEFVDPKIAASFDEWKTKLQAVADVKLFQKEFIESWKVAEDLLKTGMTTAVDQITSALAAGKVTWADWAKVATDVINMVIKKLLELTVIIPALNALFGEGTAGKGLGFGGVAAGGLIGAITKYLGGVFVGGGGAPPGQGGIGHAHAGTPIRTFRPVDMSVFLGAPRLHAGLGSDEYPAILQKGETVTPRGMTPGGAPVNINISHPKGTEAQVSRDTAGGLDTYNVVITHVQRALSKGQLDLNMGGRYGFRPAGIRR